MKFELNLGVGTEQGDQFRFSFFGVPFKMPYFQKTDNYDDIWLSWGFSYSESAIHFNWGKKTKIVSMPWDYDHRYHKVLSWDKEWIKDMGRDYEVKERDAFKDERYHSSFPYQYRLRNGEVQNVIATICIEKRIWWRIIFKYLPFWLNPIIPFKLTRKAISVDFNEEVGEERGSWKGGTVGCGYNMKKNETGYQCLRRMEQERLFEKKREY